MRKWVVISVVATCYISIGIYYFYSQAQRLSHVYGEWSKTNEGAQHNIVSKIIFNKDKSVIFMDKKGRILTKCSYSIQNDNEIDCLCSVNNKAGIIKLKSDGGKEIKNSFGDVYERL